MSPAPLAFPAVVAFPTAVLTPASEARAALAPAPAAVRALAVVVKAPSTSIPASCIIFFSTDCRYAIPAAVFRISADWKKQRAVLYYCAAVGLSTAAVLALTSFSSRMSSICC